MDEVITQLGLLLTQTRFARRALEDIERATARFAPLAAMAAAPSGAAFGSPPLLDGALRVHVVNIQELSGNNGSDIGGLFGGIGAFVGNLFGGVVGGTIGSVVLPFQIGKINTLAERIDRIIDKLGLGKAQPQPVPAAGATPAPPAGGGGTELVELLKSMSGKVDALTALLRAASGQPPTPSPAASAVNAPDAEKWRAWVDSLTDAIVAATRLVGGLVVAVPTVVAGVAWLFDRLPDFRNAIVDTLRFVVRNVLVLTQAVVVLGLETVAMFARVLAMAVRELAKIVDEALGALFAALAKLLDAALRLGGVIAGAITKTVKQLLDWLVPEVFRILDAIGELNFFKFLDKLANFLPGLLLLLGQKPPDPAKESAIAKAKPFEVKTPPDLEAAMKEVGEKAKAVTNEVSLEAKKLVDDPTNAIQRGLTDFGKKLDKAAEEEAGLSGTKLAERLKKLGTAGDEKAKALLPVEPAGAQQKASDLADQTAFHPIAAAYGQWLATGGLTKLLDSMNGYFTSPGSGTDNPSATRASTPSPVVRIDEVVIEIGPAGQPSSGPGAGATRYDADGSLLSRHGSVRELIDRDYWFGRRRGDMGQPGPRVAIWDPDTTR